MQINAKNVQNITLLAIESSCDDTAASIICNAKIVSNVIANQDIHQQYGGVVPELASRAHQKNIVPVVDMALKQANVSLDAIDGIAYTQGPGLLGSLLVGSSFAKGLALALNKPLVAVNHLEAHVLSLLIDSPDTPFPYLCLLVSGGHTEIVKVNSPSSMEILGRTIDDAAGEAFDKVAKILGLPYPGGPLIDSNAKNGDPHCFSFPSGKVPNLDFSFSGFKTAVLYFIKDAVKKDATFVEQNLSNICASVQQNIITYLLSKLKQAALQTKIKHIAIAGGVSANLGLRTEFLKMAKDQSWTTYIPKLEYCTDNAAMIAMAAHFKFLDHNMASLGDGSFASFDR